MKKDISNREDVELLIDTFYGKVMTDETIGFIFSDIAGIDWSRHLPKMYNFWCSLLFGEREYSGNPMRIHVDLSKQTEMGKKQFDNWLRLFYETVEELFEGDKAIKTKNRATKIASIMTSRINMDNKSSFVFNPNNF